MAKRPTITDVSSGYKSTDTVNTNFDNVQTAFDNTLSRDGSGPNEMNADLDMNSYDILNARDVSASRSLTVQGVDVADLISGVGSGTVFNTTNRFDGDGTTLAFTLTKDPVSRANTQVFVNGVYQQKDTYTVSGTTLTFTQAPSKGFDNIEVNIQESTSTGTPSASGVSTSDGQDVQAKLDQSHYTTRALFVADIVAGKSWSDGDVVTAGSVSYVKSTGATAISDMSDWLPFGSVYTPLHWGAVGDGSTDDGVKFNAAMTSYRTALNTQSNQVASLEFDGLGKTYRSTVPIDLTKLQTWGWKVGNFTILSEATGLISVETTGSRGGRWWDILVFGHETNEPAVGWYAARSAAGGGLGFCDNNHYSNVKTLGYFTLAGAYIYGQETTTYDHCAFWNYDPAGQAGIHVGNDTGITAVAKTHETPVTGAVSYINNVYVNCDWRHLPVGRSFTITGITLGAQTVLTVSGDPSDLLGDDVTFSQVGGTTELINLVGEVTAVTTSTLTVNINSTAFTAFTSGGTVIGTQSAPTITFGRGSDHTFQGCYSVAYGQENFRHTFPDSDVPNKNSFEFLFEGAGSASHFVFNTAGSAKTIGHTVLKTYNTHSRDQVISAADGLTWRGGELTLVNNSVGDPAWFNSAANFTLYGVDIHDTMDTSLNTSSLAAWSGTYHKASGTNQILGSFVNAPTSFYPSADKTVDYGLVNRRIRAGYFKDINLTDTLQFQSGDGVGGTVTQATSKTTAVTLNKRSGQITVSNSSLGAGATAVFEVNNSTVTATDVPLVCVASTTTSYTVDVVSSSAGRFAVAITNITGGALAQAFAITFTMGPRASTD